LSDPLLCGRLLLSPWLSAITSKVTRFTTIKTIHILAFLTATFLTLALMSTTTCFYSPSSLAIFETLSLTLFIFRVICSTYFSLRYKSLVYRLLIMKSVFLKLRCFLAQVQWSIVWLFSALLALPGDTQFYNIKHHNSFT
jgi:hypothetical protein